MNRKKDMALIGAGLLIGLMVTPSLASAAENWLKATPSTQIFIVDGENAELEAYSINGYNYVKLRDLGKAVGFDVSYDAQFNAAVIDSTRPYYDDEAAAQATVQLSTTAKQTITDYAKDANPAVFTEHLTAEVYDTIREAVVTGETTPFGSSVNGFIGLKYGDDEALFKRAEAETRQISSVLSTLGRYPNFQLASPDGTDEYLCQVQYTELYAPAVEHTRGFIDSLNGLSKREKIKQIAWYVCDRIAYDKTCYAWPNEVLTQDGVVRGACMSYAYSFQFLCQQAGIPCILVVSDIHEWNMVYAEGRWWEVDVTANDCDTVSFQTIGPHGEHSEETILAFDGTDEFRKNYYVTADRVLWDRDTEQYLSSDYTDIQPEVTEFAKEVLVPGSTK